MKIVNMKRVKALVSRSVPSLVVVAALLLTAGCDAEEPAAARSGNGGHGVAMTVEPPANPGVFEDRVVFGQSAALSGPAQQLGTEVRLGIEAAFNEANQNGGVHGRRLDLVSLDDGYEPRQAHSNTLRLVAQERVFALIGEVGTPTSFAAVPVAQSTGTPFLAPFTGAAFLRDAEVVVNLRASYHQETEHMVTRLSEDLGITRVAILYQNDTYGQDGRLGARLALERRGLSPVAEEYYQRNTSAVKTAVHSIVQADPEAVIMIGAYAPTAQAVKRIREEINPVFMSVSFVGSNALAAELGPEGTDNVYVTQVVPLPENADAPVVAAYHAALLQLDPNAAPGFVSLEGYLAGRLAVTMLESCGPDLTRDCFSDAPFARTAIDIDGFRLNFSPGDNQGSDAVFLSTVGDDGKYRLVNELEGAR